MNDTRHTDRPAPDKKRKEPEYPPPTLAPGAREFGGPAGPEPTRYGDWERRGRCIDF